MANQDVYIKIIAQDGASATFQKIGTSAQLSGNQMSTAATKASRDWGDASRKIGLALSAVSVLAVKANAESERAQARLRTSIEATGKSYDDYAEAIQKAQKAAIQKAFDDEDAADAIATLTQATGDATKAIADLSLAEDVARARGIDLAAAANIVAAAEQGRYGTLARIGIQIDANASREEALGAIQQKVAGQADAYAQTSGARWDRIRIDAENALESIGAKLAGHEAELLAVTAGWTAFGGAITSAGAALGITSAGLVAIAPELAAVGVLLAAGYYAYTHPDQLNNFKDAMLGHGSLPVVTTPHWGSRAPTKEDIAASGNENMGPIAFWDWGVNGSPPYGGSGHEAQTGGQGRPLPVAAVSEFGPRQDRAEDTMRTTRAAGNYPMASGSGPTVQALKEQYGGFVNIAAGAATAAHALEAFKTAQDGIIAGEGKYSNQINEFSGQLNALDNAYEVLQKRQAAGQELTKSDQEFLDGYTQAHERLAGGVDDATVALGKQAEQYANNMSAADAFKSAQDASTASTTALNATIIDLINALAGIPNNVTVAVNANLDPFYGIINNLLGQTIGSSYINVYANRIGFGPMAKDGITMFADGGTSGYGQYAIVGEVGPELVRLNRGEQVTNTVATQNRLRRSGGGGVTNHYHINGGVHVSANTPDEFASSLGHVRR